MQVEKTLDTAEKDPGKLWQTSLIFMRTPHAGVPTSP